jgi:asparagine synthase (glutamine-hydrolysing)
MPNELHTVIADHELLRKGLEDLQPLTCLVNLLAGGPQSNFGKVAALESCFYLRNQLLRDSDWASMAHSIELRTPLVDGMLLERILPALLGRNNATGKQLMAAAPSHPVPPRIVQRKKTGFGIPVQKWLARLRSDSTAAGQRRQPFNRDWARSVASWHNAHI